jgi:hypothetical protein
MSDITDIKIDIDALLCCHHMIWSSSLMLTTFETLHVQLCIFNGGETYNKRDF